MNSVIIVGMLITVFIASVYDYKTKRETLPIALIAFLFISLIVGDAIALLVVSLTIPVSRLLAIPLFRVLGKGSIRHILLDVIPAVLTLIMAFSASLISEGIVFLGMDKWSSQTLFSTLFLLLFSIVLEPSTEVFEALGFVIRVNIDRVVNIMNGLAHVAGFIGIAMLLQFYGAYTILVMLIWISMLLIRGRLGSYKKTLVEVSPYVITLLIAVAKGL